VRMKKNIVVIGLLLTLTLSLTACLFPQAFKASVNINNNGSFTFAYDGILTFVISRAEKVQSGKLSPRTEKGLKELGQKLAEDPAFKKVEYQGDSNFLVSYSKKGALDKPFYFVGKDIRLFSILPKPGGLVEIKGIKLSKKDISKLEALNLKLDGELTIKTDGEVIEQNATSTPSLFGMWGGYQWKITSLEDAQPKMLIKLK